MQINWEKVQGLLPAIIQSSVDHSVLMLGYMDKESLSLTEKTGEVHFYSRTKQRIWKKGETSGNLLKVVEMHLDCDGDTLLVIASPTGPICHTGNENCFDYDPPYFLNSLEKTIQKRIESDDDKSYTRSLVQKGVARVAQKVGEEGVEVAIASVKGDKQEVIEESADLLFHMLVNLQMQDLTLNDVVASLQKRRK